MAGEEEARLARLRKNWPKAQARLSRTVWVSRLAIPIAFVLLLVALYLGWNVAYSRSALLLLMLLLAPPLVHVFYWLIPRSLAVSRLSFEDYSARRRMLARSPTSKPLLYTSVTIGFGALLILGLGVVMIMTGPRTVEFMIGQVYLLVGPGLILLATSIAAAIPMYRDADRTMGIPPFAGRQTLSATVAAASGAFMFVLAVSSLLMLSMTSG